MKEITEASASVGVLLATAVLCQRPIRTTAPLSATTRHTRCFQVGDYIKITPINALMQLSLHRRDWETYARQNQKHERGIRLVRT